MPYAGEEGDTSSPGPTHGESSDTGPTATLKRVDTTMMRNQRKHESDERTTYAVISTDCSALLDTLGNRASRVILAEAAGEPVTVDDLLGVCEVSRTTIYRRVNELVDLGLLEESVAFAEGTHQQRRLRTASDEIALHIGPDGFEAQIRSNGTKTPSDTLLLNDSSLERFGIALSGTDLRFRIEADGEGATDAATSTE